MIEYIEREAALKLFDKVGCYLNTKCLERQKKQIEDLPTADVAEVRHGEWVRTGDGEYRCSVCNEEFLLDIDMHPIDDCGMYHCPNCGAKMDGKGEDNGNNSQD